MSDLLTRVSSHAVDCSNPRKHAELISACADDRGCACSYQVRVRGRGQVCTGCATLGIVI